MHAEERRIPVDAARREKKEHGTLAFPFQIYPALDGSEADDSDFIPYHWHPELEIITVDAGHVSLTIADHTYEGTHGDVFFAAGEELHEIRAAGRENQFRSFVFAADSCSFRAPTRANSRCCRRSPRDGCDSAPAFAPVNPGRTKSVRCSHRSCARGRCRRPAVSLP